jgi:hypothetical protein
MLDSRRLVPRKEERMKRQMLGEMLSVLRIFKGTRNRLLAACKREGKVEADFRREALLRAIEKSEKDFRKAYVSASKHAGDEVGAGAGKR